jgi:hypothetical protein
MRIYLNEDLASALLAKLCKKRVTMSRRSRARGTNRKHDKTMTPDCFSHVLNASTTGPFSGGLGYVDM